LRSGPSCTYGFHQTLHRWHPGALASGLGPVLWVSALASSVGSSLRQGLQRISLYIGVTSCLWAMPIAL